MSKDKSKKESNSTKESENQTSRESFPTEEQEVHEIVLNPDEIPRTERKSSQE